MKITISQLKQIIKEELEKVLNEAAPTVAGFGQSTVPVRVKKSARAGAGDERFHLSPEQERKLGSGLKPDTPGEVLKEEWLAADQPDHPGSVYFAWPRGVEGAGKRKKRLIQKNYLRPDWMVSGETE